jgi:predicted transcriptional regulator
MRKIEPEIRVINLRRALGLTQVQAAEMVSMRQSELSRLENADDMLLSTLRRYVVALGGRLEIFAVVNGKKIALHKVLR